VKPHPLYSPDFAPSKFHLFDPLKEALQGKQFYSDCRVKNVMHNWLSKQPKKFFSDRILHWLHDGKHAQQEEGTMWKSK
jgi:hypothetical protein